MKSLEADVIWTPINARQYDHDADAGAVRVERHLSGWERTPGDRWMPATCLGVMGEYETKGDPIKELLAMFILFNTIVVRDGVPVAAAHAAFLAIDEYRAAVSPDTPGADRCS